MAFILFSQVSNKNTNGAGDGFLLLAEPVTCAQMLFFLFKLFVCVRVCAFSHEQIS